MSAASFCFSWKPIRHCTYLPTAHCMLKKLLHFSRLSRTTIIVESTFDPFLCSTHIHTAEVTILPQRLRFSGGRNLASCMSFTDSYFISIPSPYIIIHMDPPKEYTCSHSEFTRKLGTESFLEIEQKDDDLSTDFKPPNWSRISSDSVVSEGAARGVFQEISEFIFMDNK